MHSYRSVLLVLFWLAGSIMAHAESDKYKIRITSIRVDPIMPANPRDWNTTNLAIRAETSDSVSSPYSKLIIKVKQNGRDICGNGSEIAALAPPFRSRTFSIADFAGSLGSCPVLSPGTYTLGVRFYSEQNEPLSEEVNIDFAVKETTTTKVNTYEPPRNLAPEDNALLDPLAAKKGMQFRWSEVSPRPDESVTYRLRIWPLAGDENASTVIGQKQAAITKDITDATALFLTEDLAALCREYPSCRLVWNVQALNSTGASFARNNGYSQPTAIVLTSYIIQINDIKVNCTATPGIYTFSYIVGNVNPGTAKLTNFAVTSSTPGGAIITSFSPPLNTNITSGGQITITGTISASSSLSNICIGAEITDVANSFNKASKDTCIPVPACRCDACDPKKTNININPTSNIVVNANNTLTLNQPISVTTTPLKLVKSIRADLIYFEFLPDNEDCLPCNKDSRTFGNMDNGTLAGSYSAGSGTHSLYWIFAPAKNFSTAGNAAITITLPPMVQCCAATIRWCIRYTITFNDCTTCSKVVCYQKKKDGCSGGNGNPNNN